MRDILYKNLTSPNHKKRDVFLSELSVEKGITTKTQKHFMYFIRSHAVLDGTEDLKGWIKKYACQGPRLNNLSVLKSYDSKNGEEKFEVKIAGNLYVLREHDIFNVDFTQEFEVDRRGESLKK